MEKETIIYGNASPQNIGMPVYGSAEFKEHFEIFVTSAKVYFVSPKADGGKDFFLEPEPKPK